MISIRVQLRYDDVMKRERISLWCLRCEKPVMGRLESGLCVCSRRSLGLPPWKGSKKKKKREEMMLTPAPPSAGPGNYAEVGKPGNLGTGGPNRPRRR